MLNKLAKLSADSLQADILKDHIQDDEHKLLVADWAGGLWEQFANLGMATKFRDVSFFDHYVVSCSIVSCSHDC